MEDHCHPKNPCGYKYPLLVLHLDGVPAWHVEIDGQIGQYLNLEDRAVKNLSAACSESGLSGDALQTAATPLLKKIARKLRVHELIINRVGWYTGAGPSHILRDGTFFARMIDIEADTKKTGVPSWMDAGQPVHDAD
ncbi:MAG: hypothetical protein EXS46_02290 [Candidatus Taylorbacteria bacterium]|nr:hypothetical protein [Candidatus Taylorbacteria bacterium]